MLKEKQNQILQQLNGFSPKLICQLKNLTEKDWSTQSRCDDWTVKDVMAHLSSVLTNYLIFIDSAKNEENILDDLNSSRVEPGTLDGKSLAGLLSERAKETSKSFNSEDVLINELELRFQRLLDGFNSCQDNQWNLPAYHPVNWVSIQGILLWTLL